jgi:hypothetical protein
MNARGTVATVNVFKKNLETTQGTKSDDSDDDAAVAADDDVEG